MIRVVRNINPKGNQVLMRLSIIARHLSMMEATISRSRNIVESAKIVAIVALVVVVVVLPDVRDINRSRN